MNIGGSGNVEFGKGGNVGLGRWVGNYKGWVGNYKVVGGGG